MIEAIKRALRSTPVSMMPGLVIFALASAVDLAFHLAPFGWGEVMESYLGGEGYLAHMGILAGMTLTIAGLILWGATKPGRPRQHRSERIERATGRTYAQVRETAASVSRKEYR